MASSRVPKLVVKRHKPTRRLKLPTEVAAASQQEGRAQTGTRRLTQATVRIRRAKRSLKRNGYLMLVGACAAIVMYGIISVSTAEDTGNGRAANIESENGSTSSMNAAGNGGQQGEKSAADYLEYRDKKNPEIIVRVTTTPDGPKVERYREVKIPKGKILIPIPEEKPEPLSPPKGSDEQDREHRRKGGILPQ